MPWTIFGVTWHRLILLDQPPSSAPLWSPAHWRFAAYLTAWQIPWLLFPDVDPDAQYAGLAMLTTFALGLLVACLQARFGIFLPAAAVDRPISPIQAWNVSRGYGAAIFWAGMMCLLVFMAAALPLLVPLLLAVPDRPETAGAIFGFALLPLQIGFEALAVGTLSFAYREIEGRSAV